MTLVALVFWLAGAVPDAAAERRLVLSGDAGFGGMAGMAQSSLALGVEVQEGGLSLGLFGRVRFVLDRDRDEGPLRRRDWDEVSDYVHLLRELRYQRSFGRTELDVRVGEQAALTLGHGTLVREYSNLGDPDHLHSGIAVELVRPRFDVRAFLDNFIHPSLVGARLGLRPFARAPRLGFGASFTIDPRAPVRVETDARGVRQVDAAWNLETEHRTLTHAGVDVQVVLGNPDRGQVTPYADFNTSFYGVGMHLGGMGRLPLGRTGVTLTGQLEYHVGTGGYAAAYVQTFYDVDRHQASLNLPDPARPDAAAHGPKLAALGRGLFGGHGALAQLGVEAPGRVTLRAGFEHQAGPDPNRLWVRFGAQPADRLNVAALLLLRHLGPGAAPGGVAAAVEGRFRVTRFLYALGQYSRLWSLDAETRYYGIVQAFNLGLGGNWSI
ncbi:MAG: hypothetical protein IT371_13385 [Deltaproteobacteria bacterium]|nr:hypothetical protein [Deltaproteobacteria bacterium]